MSALQVVVESLVRYGEDHPEAVQVNLIEPKFGLEFVRTVFPEFVSFVDELLAPALKLTPAVRSGATTSGELSELILRVVSSTYFIPPRNIDDVPKALATLPCLRTAAR